MNGSMELRRHQRIVAKSGDVIHPEFKCLDLSESGSRFQTAREVRIGTEFFIEISALSDSIKVKCVVVWCQKSVSIFENGYHIGVKFEGLSIRNQLQLRELIKQRL